MGMLSLQSVKSSSHNEYIQEHICVSVRTWAILTICLFITQHHLKRYPIRLNENFFHLQTVIGTDLWRVSIFTLCGPPQSADRPLRLSHLIIDPMDGRILSDTLLRHLKHHWRSLKEEKKDVLYSFGEYRTLREKRHVKGLAEGALTQLECYLLRVTKHLTVALK